MNKGVIKLIEINERYRIGSDKDKNIILYEKVHKRERDKKNKTWVELDETTDVVRGYYPNLEVLLKSLVKKEIIGTGLKDIETIQDKIEELQKIIKKTIKQYYKEE